MAQSPLTLDELTARILPHIEAGVDAPFSESDFNELALAEFAFQYANNEILREFAQAKGVNPETIGDWSEIPLVYNDVFKKTLVSSFPLEKTVMSCLTSGTTSLTQRGRIFREENGQKLVFTANRVMTQHYVFPDFADGARCRILILAPSPDVAPSMGMAIGMEQTRRCFGTDDSIFLLKRSGIDVGKLIKALRESEESGVPVALIGATSAFVYFFQACRRDGMRFSLPQGSRVCDGGGYRGRFGVITRDDYYDMVEDLLGISANFCVNTLGEAETATNLFDDALSRHYQGKEERVRLRPVPPWARVRAFSTDDLAPLPDGEVGLLAHWDLANAPTVLGVITDNLGFTSDNGTACEIVGRARLDDGGKVSSLPDEERTLGAMGDTPIFRMLEKYVNFTIDLKMHFAKDPNKTPSIREEVELDVESVPSCPQVIDEMLSASDDSDAAELRDASLEAFKKQAQESPEIKPNFP